MNAHIIIKVPNIKHNKPISSAKNILMANTSGITKKMINKTHDIIAILYFATLLFKEKIKTINRQKEMDIRIW